MKGMYQCTRFYAISKLLDIVSENAKCRDIFSFSRWQSNWESQYPVLFMRGSRWVSSKIVEIGSSISKTSRSSNREWYSASAIASKWISWWGREWTALSREMRIGAAGNEELNSVERHYLPSLHWFTMKF